MTEPCVGNECDKVCSEHKTTDLLLKQHSERLHGVEKMTIDISNDISNLEGRVNTFIWIIGVAFFLLCSIAFYGAIQIDRFKTMYMEDTIAMNKALFKLTATVTTSTERIDDVKEELKKVKEELE